MVDKSDDCFDLQQVVDLVNKVNIYTTRKIQAIRAFASHREAAMEAHPHGRQAGYLLLALREGKR